MRLNFVNCAKAGGVLAIIAVIVVVGVSSGKQLRRQHTRGDIEVYVHASHLMLAGENIYTIPESRGGLYYLYLPLFAVLTIPFTLFSVKVLIVFWCVLNVVLVGWIIVTFYQAMTGRSFFSLPRNSKWILGFFSILLTLRAILYHLDLAQANIPVLAVAVLGLKFLGRRENIKAGITIGISTVLKIITLPLTALFLGRRDVKVFAGIVLGVVLGLLLPALLVGGERNLLYLDYWVRNVIVGTDISHNTHWPLKFNYSAAAQLYRFFSETAVFEHNGHPYYFTIFTLPPRALRWSGYLITVLTGLILAWYGARYRKSSELVGKWGGVALSFSLAPVFSTIAQKHYFVLLLPAHVYVVYLWHCLRLEDNWFRGLVVTSFIIATLSTNIFGYMPGAIVSNAGGLIWGTLLLAAAIFRAANCLNREPNI